MVIHGLKALENKFENLIREPPKTVHQVAKIGFRMLRVMAPKKSGKLKRGITVKKISKNESSIISTAINPETDFPYNFWVNQEDGFSRVKIYGGKERTYAGTRHTGIPGFFTVTAQQLEKQYAKSMNITISKILRQ